MGVEFHSFTGALERHLKYLLKISGESHNIVAIIISLLMSVFCYSPTSPATPIISTGRGPPARSSAVFNHGTNSAAP